MQLSGLVVLAAAVAGEKVEVNVPVDPLTKPPRPVPILPYWKDKGRGCCQGNTSIVYSEVLASTAQITDCQTTCEPFGKSVYMEWGFGSDTGINYPLCVCRDSCPGDTLSQAPAPFCAPVQGANTGVHTWHYSYPTSIPWSAPMPTGIWHFAGSGQWSALSTGSSADVNGDGLPDVTISFQSEIMNPVTTKGSTPMAYMGTYLNYGAGYCIAWENENLAAARVNWGKIYGCTELPAGSRCIGYGNLTKCDTQADFLHTKMQAEQEASVELARRMTSSGSMQQDLMSLLESHGLSHAAPQLARVGLRSLDDLALVEAPEDLPDSLPRFTRIKLSRVGRGLQEAALA